MKFRKEILSNGIRLVYCHLPKRKSVSARIAVGAGTRQESRRYKGLAHFVEHMAFKGSWQFPSPLEIGKVLGETGAHVNADTDREITRYFIDSSRDNIDQALEVVLDMFFYPRYRSRELRLESGVILSEHRDYLDDPVDFVDNLQSQLVFGMDNPLGWPIVGNGRSIPEIGLENLRNFHRHYYSQTNNIVVSLAGNFTSRTLQKLRKYLQDIPESTSNLPKSNYRNRQTVPRLAVKYWDGKQVYFKLGFRAYHYLHPKVHALNVLDSLLGGGWNSRLLVELREKRGLIYSFETDRVRYKECGNYEIFASLHGRYLKLALEIVLAELKKVREELVSQSELKKVHKLFSERVNDLDGSDEISDLMLFEELFEGKFETPKEWLAKIKAVTPEEVRAVAREIFQDSRLNLALVGSNINHRKIKKILTVE